MRAKIHPNKPFVIMLYGFPGVGKSTFARQLAEEISVAHLHEDRLAHELLGTSNNQGKESRNTLNFMTKEFLRAGVSVIYDADVLRTAERREIRNMAAAHKAIPLLIWIQLDPDTAYHRVERRDRRKIDDKYSKDYTPDIFEATINGMQNPVNEDYIVLSGKHTFHSQRATVYKRMYELNILTPDQTSKNVTKPALVNLVPQSMGGRPDLSRRNINIRG